MRSDWFFYVQSLHRLPCQVAEPVALVAFPASAHFFARGARCTVFKYGLLRDSHKKKHCSSKCKTCMGRGKKNDQWGMMNEE